MNAYVCNGMNGPGATRAAGPCFDNTNRYVNCGNGTVTDTVTGLIWLKDAACAALGNPGTDWVAANVAAAGLKDGDCGLTDKSSPGDWRLPTRDEWSATIARAVALGCVGSGPSLTNDAGTGCLSVGPSSFAGVASLYYWSAATSETVPVFAWMALLNSGGDGAGSKVMFNSMRVWPVLRRIALETTRLEPFLVASTLIERSQFESFPYVADTTASVDRVAPVTAPSRIVRSNVARQPPIFLAKPRR